MRNTFDTTDAHQPGGSGGIMTGVRTFNLLESTREMIRAGALGFLAGWLALIGVVLVKGASRLMRGPDAVGLLLGIVVACVIAYPAAHLAWLYRRCTAATQSRIMAACAGLVLLSGFGFWIVVPGFELQRIPLSVGVCVAMGLAWAAVRRIPPGAIPGPSLRRWAIASWIVYGVPALVGFMWVVFFRDA